jgi:hypothetical protein
VLEGEEGWAQIPEGMRNMGPDHIYRIHDPGNRGIPDFILSHVVERKMNHDQAVAYCRDQGARLPTKEEYEALGRAMGRDERGKGYQRNLIPEMEDRWFWSSLYGLGDDFAYYFYGNFGSVGYVFRNGIYGSVRCVVAAPQRG